MEVPNRGSTVGVVGRSAPVREPLANAGYEVVDADPRAGHGPDTDWLVAVGSQALLDAVAARPDGPVLAVDTEVSVPSIPVAAAADAIRAVAKGDAETVTRRLTGVDLNGESVARSLLDVLLVTDEPARISEFAVRVADDTVTQVRADGVVVATPAGSGEYAAAVGGPVVRPGTGVLSVVPVAPFVTDADHWVLPDEAVTVAIERETPVALVVDGQERRLLGHEDVVTVGADGTISLLTVPGAGPTADRQLEKH